MMNTHFIDRFAYRFAIAKISMFGSSEPGDDPGLSNGVSE
jgi:hypothetical protein